MRQICWACLPVFENIHIPHASLEKRKSCLGVINVAYVALKDIVKTRNSQERHIDVVCVGLRCFGWRCFPALGFYLQTIGDRSYEVCNLPGHDAFGHDIENFQGFFNIGDAMYCNDGCDRALRSNKQQNRCSESSVRHIVPPARAFREAMGQKVKSLTTS